VPARREPLGPDEVRRAQVPVPAGYRQQSVKLIDRRHGFALFGCDSSRSAGASPSAICPSVLIATSDGGRSWRQLRHPEPTAVNQQLLVEDGHVVLADRHGWHISDDRGRTFRRHLRSAGPPAVLQPRFRVCCDPTPRLERWVDGGYRPVPVQPPVAGLSTAAFDNAVRTQVLLDVEDGRVLSRTGTMGALVAAGLHQGEVHVAISVDEGRTWRKTGVPVPDGELNRLRIAFSTEGEVWLFGYHLDFDRFPQLWHYSGQIWEPVAAVGHPDRVVSLVPIGARMLAATGPGGSGVVAAGHYNDLRWPLVGDVLVLEDGTLVNDHPDGSVWLGEGSGTERRWVKTVLVPAA